MNIFYFLHIPSRSDPSTPLSNAHLKHLRPQRAHGSLRQDQLERETASPSSRKQASASPRGWEPARLMLCGWLLSTVTEGLLRARYCAGRLYLISFNPPASPGRQVWLPSLVQFRKLPKTQLAKLQDEDSDFVWLNLYQMHLVFLRPSTYLHLPLHVQSSRGGSVRVPFLSLSSAPSGCDLCRGCCAWGPGGPVHQEGRTVALTGLLACRPRY